MNAPTGRKASVSVRDKAISASLRWNSRAIAVSVITTTKKSNASSVQPRKPATTAARWSEAAEAGAGGKGGGGGGAVEGPQKAPGGVGGGPCAPGAACSPAVLRRSRA